MSTATTAKLLKRLLTGAAAGGALGYYATPHISGYSDVPQAKRVSAYSDALLGAALGLVAHRVGGFRKGLKILRKLPLKTLAAGAGAAALGELPPIMVASQTKQRQAAEMLTNAAKQVGQAASTVSIPDAIRKTLTHPASKGALVGASGAGLLALLTALSRPKTEKEIKERTSRSQMVTSDFLKFLLPAMLAGGVAGSLIKKRQE